MSRLLPSPRIDLQLAQAHELVRRLGEPLLGGSLLKPYPHPEPAVQALLQSLPLARDHVNLDAGLLRLPGLAEPLVQALREALQRGVRVHLLAGATEGPAVGRALAHLRGAGARVGQGRRDGALRAWLDRRLPGLQRQLLVMDGRSAWLAPPAGRNPCDAPSSPLYLNLQGPAVQRLQRLFVSHWRQATGLALPVARYFPPLALAGGSRLGLANAEPHPPDRCPRHHALLGALNLARHSVRIGLGSGPASPALWKALGEAAARGVQVVVLQDVRPGLSGVAWPWRGRGPRAVGVQVYRRDRAGGPPQRPVCTIDGVWCSVALCDAPHRGARLAGIPSALLAIDADAAAALGEHFDAMLAQARRLDGPEATAAMPWLDQDPATSPRTAGPRQG